MSVYGGDSWAREAHHRKRRVEELMIDGLDSSSFKKLSNGKFTCLVCPNHPLLDSSLMLSMHRKGARHCAALTKLQERELDKQEEIKKRKALSGSDHPKTSASAQRPAFRSKPLIEQTRKAASEILHVGNAPQGKPHSMPVNPSSSTVHHAVEQYYDKINSHRMSEVNVMTAHQHLDFRERQEKELKFTAAGWKRDCHGRWYRDESVEFDSDEEDPNIRLA